MATPRYSRMGTSGNVGDGSRKYQPFLINALADIGLRSRYVGRQRIHPLACISLHMTVSEPQTLEAGPSAQSAREPPGCPQRHARCVAMWRDAQRRVVERCDAPRGAALPTMMSISPTRLIGWAGLIVARRLQDSAVAVVDGFFDAPIAVPHALPHLDRFWRRSGHSYGGTVCLDRSGAA